MSDNPWDAMRAALSQARSVMRAADDHAGVMADLLRGRLRNVPAYHLVALKRELRDFDAHTKRWK